MIKSVFLENFNVHSGEVQDFIPSVITQLESGTLHKRVRFDVLFWWSWRSEGGGIPSDLIVTNISLYLIFRLDR